MTRTAQRAIQVWADWGGLPAPHVMGVLYATPSRGKEIFSFEYDHDWLGSQYRQEVDPELRLLGGPQYASQTRLNLGVFLDSSPDRWGRVLMQRREDREAR